METQEINEIEDYGLSPEEEQELMELEQKAKGRKVLKGALLMLIILLIAAGSYGVLRLYPFTSKFSGTWVDAESGNYVVENKRSESMFKIENIQDSVNLTLIFKGELYGAGSNRYKTKNNEVFLEVVKHEFPKEALEEFEKDSESYEVVKNDEDVLLLKYTNKALKVAFGEEDVDKLFYYELTNFGFGLKSKEVKLRNTTFASNTLKLVREKAEK